jgi:hypothetical protein
MCAAKVPALIGLSAQLLLLGPSGGADYPSRSIKLLVGASAGGAGFGSPGMSALGSETEVSPSLYDVRLFLKNRHSFEHQAYPFRASRKIRNDAYGGQI